MELSRFENSEIESFDGRSSSDTVAVQNTANCADVAASYNSESEPPCLSVPVDETNGLALNHGSLKPAMAKNITTKKRKGPTDGLMIKALASLAIFIIFGVMIRHGLEDLLGLETGDITAEEGFLFTSLPANMVGCFFMCLVGTVLKPSITNISQMLAVGLTTGLMGSITTFSSWNQSMIFALRHGYYLKSFSALLLGVEIAHASYAVGMDTAKLVKKFFFDQECCRATHENKAQFVFIVAGTCIWPLFLVLAILDIHHPTRRKVWLGCVLGPLGTWIRWFLSKLNGRGVQLGPRRRLKWFPVGTFLANFIAAFVTAVVALIKEESSNVTLKLVMESVELGLLGCMSTVSTVTSEAHSLRKGRKPWRSYAYLLASLFVSMAFSLATFSSPQNKKTLNDAASLCAVRNSYN